MSGVSEFGKDLGLLHEVVVTGRKAGWGPSEWAKLAHDGDLMASLLLVLQGRAEVVVRSRLTTPTVIKLPEHRKPQRLADRHGVWLSPEAKKLFASVKTLPNQEKREMSYADLCEPFGDFDIIADFGDKEKVVFPTVDRLQVAIVQLMDMTDGGTLSLHADGKANIFYVPDPENSARLVYVYVHRHGDEWSVHCNPAHGNHWDAGNRVFRATAPMM